MGFEPHILNLLTLMQNACQQSHTRAYIVGGFLRDLLLHRPAEDIDIAITADIENTGPQLAEQLDGRFIRLDEPNHIARITLPRPPGSIAGIKHLDINTIVNNILSDLARRDFTVNAMALPLESAAISSTASDILPDIIDPYGGRDDIERKIIATVSDRVFAEDGLRLLRSVRLSIELGFGIDSATLDLIRKQAHYINGIAGERIREELLRIFKQTQTGNVILLLDALGVLERLIPELLPCRQTLQPKEHHWPVFGHSVKCVDAVDFLLGKGNWPYASDAVRETVPWSEKLCKHFHSTVTGISSRRDILKIAALLHDIAKPETRTLNSEGRIRFYSHPAKGAPVVRDILARLRFSSKEIKMASGLTHHHLRPVQMNQRAQLPTDRAIYRYLRDTGDIAIDTLFLSLADHLAARGPDLESGFWAQHCRVARLVIDKMESLANSKKKVRLINGHDLLDNFKLSPGPLIAKILEAVAEAYAVGEISTREQALELAEKIISNRGIEQVDPSGYRQGKGIVKP
ncbi:MAG: CCA tRNA nucleotidyltransferase [Dehalococcoidaceae bacterium]|nr:CCA tRNA nucleotidyltransferase [Dehalococcoidaceae bacterium]